MKLGKDVHLMPNVGKMGFDRNFCQLFGCYTLIPEKKMVGRHPSYMVIFSAFDALKTRFLVQKFENSVDAEISDDHLSALQRVLGFETFFGTFCR